MNARNKFKNAFSVQKGNGNSHNKTLNRKKVTSPNVNANAILRGKAKVKSSKAKAIIIKTSSKPGMTKITSRSPMALTGKGSINIKMKPSLTQTRPRVSNKTISLASPGKNGVKARDSLNTLTNSSKTVSIQNIKPVKANEGLRKDNTKKNNLSIKIKPASQITKKKISFNNEKTSNGSKIKSNTVHRSSKIKSTTVSLNSQNHPNTNANANTNGSIGKNVSNANTTITNIDLNSNAIANSNRNTENNNKTASSVNNTNPKNNTKPLITITAKSTVSLNVKPTSSNTNNKPTRSSNTNAKLNDNKLNNKGKPRSNAKNTKTTPAISTNANIKPIEVNSRIESIDLGSSTNNNTSINQHQDTSIKLTEDISEIVRDKIGLKNIKEVKANDGIRQHIEQEQGNSKQIKDKPLISSTIPREVKAQENPLENPNTQTHVEKANPSKKKEINKQKAKSKDAKPSTKLNNDDVNNSKEINTQIQIKAQDIIDELFDKANNQYIKEQLKHQSQNEIQIEQLINELFASAIALYIEETQIGKEEDQDKTSKDINSIPSSITNNQPESIIPIELISNNKSQTKPKLIKNKKETLSGSSSEEIIQPYQTEDTDINLAHPVNSLIPNLIDNVPNNHTENLNGLSSKGSSFIEGALLQINFSRQHPKEFATLIEESVNRITTDESNRLIYQYRSSAKIALFKGKEAFLSTAKGLKAIKPLDALILKENIAIPIDTAELAKPKTNIRKYFEFQTASLAEKYPIASSWFDHIPEPQTAIIMMLVDCCNQKPIARKKNDLLSPMHTQIGISYVKIKKRFFAFYTFMD